MRISDWSSDVCSSDLSYAGVVIAGVFLVNSRDLTTGGLVACSILSGRAVAPLSSIAQLLSRMTQARTAYRQLNAMMEQPSEGPQGEALQPARSEEHTSELQSLMRISYAVFCLKKKKTNKHTTH